MAAFVEISPTGVETWVDGDEANRLQVHYRQDVEPILDYAKLIRDDGDFSAKGIKNDFWLYAVIPPVVILQLRHKGIDLYRDPKRALREINENYPHLKCTTKRHTLNH